MHGECRPLPWRASRFVSLPSCRFEDMLDQRETPGRCRPGPRLSAHIDAVESLGQSRAKCFGGDPRAMDPRTANPAPSCFPACNLRHV